MKIKLVGCDDTTFIDLENVNEEQRKIIEEIARISTEFQKANSRCCPNLVIEENSGHTQENT
jgi:ABC-type uncharacterized transport system ATPase component